MKRKGYFWILFLSGVSFLGCFLIFMVQEHSRNLLKEETTIIDFVEQTEQIKQSTPEHWNNVTEVQEDTDQLSTVQITNEIDNFTEIEKEINSIVLESTENETINEIATVEIEKEFYSIALTEDIKEYITGKSYPDTTEPIEISYDTLAYVHILHYDFEGRVQEGELICNQAIAQDLVDIFHTLYEHQYAIEKVRLIDEYNADDALSMADNKTSCFNYRTVPDKSKLSNHSYGCAIDINPLYNPYVRTRNGVKLISPENGTAYADRNADFPHKIDKEDLCYQLFIEHGFTWGGAWNSSKDYQHFEKTKNN